MARPAASLGASLEQSLRVLTAIRARVPIQRHVSSHQGHRRAHRPLPCEGSATLAPPSAAAAQCFCPTTEQRYSSEVVDKVTWPAAAASRMSLSDVNCWHRLAGVKITCTSLHNGLKPSP